MPERFVYIYLYRPKKSQLLLNTTGNSNALSTLMKLGETRHNVSAVNVGKSVGLTVLSGNSFNVTAATDAESGDGLSTFMVEFSDLNNLLVDFGS